jgi:hypothetical protein
MGAALGGIATLVGVIGSAIAALISPAGLAVAAIAGLGAAFFKYTRAGGVALAWLTDRFAALSRFRARRRGRDLGCTWQVATCAPRPT